MQASRLLIRPMYVSIFSFFLISLIIWIWKVYSNGLSETILGNAIKQLKLPRDEIVVMTKVFRQS